MNEPTDPVHPAWYHPHTDFGQSRYGFACRIGWGAAAVSDDWGRIEAILQGHWLVVHGGLTWEEARPAIYHSWLVAKTRREA
jgi:hypothetical protein